MFHHRLGQNCLFDFGSILTLGVHIGQTRTEEALAGFAGALDEALVLGHDHLVRSIGRDPETQSFGRKLSSDGPLMHWTAEDPMSYQAFREEIHTY